MLNYSGDIFSDEVHYNSKGYSIHASRIANALLSRFEKNSVLSCSKIGVYPNQDNIYLTGKSRYFENDQYPTPSQADITKDVSLELTDEILTALNNNVSNYRRFKWQHYNGKGITFTKDIIGKGKEEIKFYNKHKELSATAQNRRFLDLLASREQVEDYFSDCAEEVGLELETRGIQLCYANYVDSDVQVIADGEQIRRVIHNIISNAIKYMDKGKGMKGIIQIRVKDVGDFVQVEIEDNGKGIAAKDLPYIFDRFYRTDVSRNSAKGGSGIGLSIVRKILEDHGGKVWATSREDIGTIMYFVLRKYQEVPVNE